MKQVNRRFRQRKAPVAYLPGSRSGMKRRKLYLEESIAIMAASSTLVLTFVICLTVRRAVKR